MKFKYNPTLDRLLLVANYAQAGKTKKMENALQDVVASDTAKDIHALNRLQVVSATKQKPVGEQSRIPREDGGEGKENAGWVISMGVQQVSGKKGAKIVAAWTEDYMADMVKKWWAQMGIEFHFQLWTDLEQDLKLVSRKKKDTVKLSTRKANNLLISLPLWKKGSLDNSKQTKSKVFWDLINSIEASFLARRILKKKEKRERKGLS